MTREIIAIKSFGETLYWWYECVSYLALKLIFFQLIESCVKNCGQLIHDEVCTKAFMEELRELVKHATDENVKQKILEILQTWGMAFRNQSKYRIVTVR
jgi:hypothetical protein